MWTSVADNGVAALFKPWQIRRVARAEADRMRLIAQGQRDADLILKGEKSLSDVMPTGKRIRDRMEQREEPDFDLASLPAIVNDQYVGNALRQEVNVTRALFHAEDELVNDTSPAPEQKLDSDWLRRWRDIVGEVSSEDLQQLWGRLLAGEVKSPGRHSLRTLDIIRNISSDDAKLVAKLAPYAINGFIWREHGISEHLERAGLTFNDLLYLEEIGIITGTAGTISNTWSSQNEPFNVRIITGNLGLLAKNPSIQLSVEIRGMMLTRAGQQLLELCEVVADLEFLRSLGQQFTQRGCEVQICHVHRRSEDTWAFLTIESL